MPLGAFQGLAVSVQGSWECGGDGEPGQLTGPPLGPPAHARDVQGCHPVQADGWLGRKKKNAPGEKILVLHAHLGSARSLRLAAIFSPSIFCLGFHRPVQLPKHIFCCYLICKKFFIPLFLFITPGHLSRILLPDRPTPGCFVQCAVSLLPCLL